MNALRDQNDAPVLLGVSTDDDSTPLQWTVDPVTDYLQVFTRGDTISAVSATLDDIDENNRPTLWGISNDDGTTLIPIRTDSAGRLLVKFD